MIETRHETRARTRPRPAALAFFSLLAATGCLVDQASDPEPFDVSPLIEQGPDTPFRHVLGASIAPDSGSVVFTTQDAESGEAALMRASVPDGAVTTVAVGEPILAPVGVAYSSDGTRAFVADIGSGILDVALPGGPAKVALPGYAALDIEVVANGGRDTIVFSGRDSEGAQGVFATDGAGTATALATDFAGSIGAIAVRSGPDGGFTVAAQSDDDGLIYLIGPDRAVSLVPAPPIPAQVPGMAWRDDDHLAVSTAPSGAIGAPPVVTTVDVGDGSTTIQEIAGAISAGPLSLNEDGRGGWGDPLAGTILNVSN